MSDLAEHAAPFDDDAVDVARTEEFRDPRGFVERVLMDAGDDLFGAAAVAARPANATGRRRRKPPPMTLTLDQTRMATRTKDHRKATQSIRVPQRPLL